MLDLLFRSPRAYSAATTISQWFANRVSNMAHGVNQWRITDFFSQTADEDFHQFGVVFMGMLPNAFSYFGPREYTIRFTHEHFQQRQLAGRQIEPLLPPVSFMVHQIER